MKSYLLSLLQNKPRLMSFYLLLRKATSNPVKFLKLVTIRRIKNFFLLLFKRRDLIEQITANYTAQLDTANQMPESLTVKVHTEEDYKHLDLAFTLDVLPKVSVVIPVYNQLDYTLACLHSIRKNLPLVSIEILIVDDCSADNTQAVLGGVEGIKYIRNRENLGFLRSCNLAVKSAVGEYVFFLNNDTTVRDGWLDELVKIFDNRPDAGLVGSKLIYPDGRLQEAGGIVWQDGSGWNYGKLDDPLKPEYNYVKEVDYVSGAAIMVSRDLFIAMEGFDERYAPAYYEDTDLAFEIRKLGKKVYYQPSSVIVHYEGVSNGVDTGTGVKKHQLINQQLFQEKWETELSASHFNNAENIFEARDRALNKTTILIIDHYVPHFDKDAGSKSTYIYIQLLLSQGYSVKFLGDNFYKHEPYTSILEQHGVEVLYGEYYRKNWQNWLKDNSSKIDVVYTMRPHISEKYVKFINKLPNRPKIIYFGHDLHYLRIKRQYEVEKRRSLLKESSVWKKQEGKLFNAVDVVYYPSVVEVNEVKNNFPSVEVKAIPLYVFSDVEWTQRNDCKDLIFVGGFNHLPNVDGLNWFCREIFPTIVQSIPSIKLHVVGSHMPEGVKKLACDNVVIHGFLSDEKLNKLYELVRMSVIPLRFGAGVKGKVLEAMHKSLPVITTSVGAEGIPEADTALIVEDASDGFAEKLLQSYTNDQVLEKHAVAGCEVIRKFFSERAALKVIEEDFNNIDFISKPSV
jgi:GT2 family glycosyltransferase/glycosyltransferase involved in cell wall biosynthesis